MSPEQWGEGNTDRQTDIWSVGVLLHRCVSGYLPFGDGCAVKLKIAMEVLSPHSQAPCLIHGYEENFPIDPSLALVVRTALQKDKHKRFVDAKHMLDAIRPAYESVQV